VLAAAMIVAIGCRLPPSWSLAIVPDGL